MNRAELLEDLSALVPKAVAWAEQQSRTVQQSGTPLADFEIALAKSVGVQQSELVRVREVPQLPMPEDTELREAALQLGILGPTMSGLTLGHSIFICAGHRTSALLAHELRHVYQYELAGSVAEYLPAYFEQLIYFGYRRAPLEIDAREHEVQGPTAIGGIKKQ